MQSGYATANSRVLLCVFSTHAAAMLAQQGRGVPPLWRTWTWRCLLLPPEERVAMARSRWEGMKVGAMAGMPSRLGCRSTVVPLRVTTQHFSTCTSQGAGGGGRVVEEQGIAVA
jgi:hypothetical protein